MLQKVMKKNKTLVNSTNLKVDLIVIDSELDNDIYLSLQVYIPFMKCVYFFYNEDYTSCVESVEFQVSETFKEYNKDVHIIYKPFHFNVDTEDFNKSVINALEIDLEIRDYSFADNVQIQFYYSMKDVYALFNKPFIASFFKQKRPQKPNQCFIVQEGCYKGSFKTLWNEKSITFKLKDLAGYERSGLKKLLNVCNVTNPVKNDFEDKSIMSFHFQNTPSKFVIYGIYDVLTTSEVVPNLLKKVNTLYKEVYKFPADFLLTRFTLPGTLGGIVSNLIEKWIYFEMCSEKNNENEMGEKEMNWSLFEEFDKIDEKLSIKKRFQKKRRMEGKRKNGVKKDVF